LTALTPALSRAGHDATLPVSERLRGPRRLQRLVSWLRILLDGEVVRIDAPDLVSLHRSDADAVVINSASCASSTSTMVVGIDSAYVRASFVNEEVVMNTPLRALWP
jgi:hypothetical protein